MEGLNLLVRWVVGVLFIFSGLIKANDPLGLSYKMQEFFEAWHLNGLHNFTLSTSIAMNILEVIAGVAIIIGWQKKWFAWLLFLLIGFFTFLTSYVLFSGKIKACGCFGDCIPLTPYQTFSKDIVLLACSIFILLNLSTIKPMLSAKFSKILLVLVFIFTLSVQLYALIYLPFIDCLPYKKNNDILEQMKAPKDAIQDSIITISNYKSKGKIVAIIGDDFPEDFDSTYEMINREDKIIRQGNAEPKIKDFTLFSTSGTDTTTSIFEKEEYMLVFINKINPAQTIQNEFNIEVVKTFVNKGIDVFVVANSTKVFDEINTKGVHFLICDATVMKTAARVNTTYFLMNKAVIKNKVSYKNVTQLLNN